MPETKGIFSNPLAIGPKSGSHDPGIAGCRKSKQRTCISVKPTDFKYFLILQGKKAVSSGESPSLFFKNGMFI